jgi:phosphohistidine phosphatase
MSRIWELPASALQVHESLYLASSSEIHQVIATASPDVAGLAIFGHNPSFTDYANHFLPDSLDNLPTAGVVMVTFDCDRWKDIGRSAVQNTFLDYPKRRN